MSATLVETLFDPAVAVPASLSVDQYHRMIETGVLLEGMPIELIDGLLIRKDRRDSRGGIMTVGTRHTMILQRLARQLSEVIPARYGHVRQQQPLTLSATSEPEPDIAVVRGSIDDYAAHHPAPADVLLVVEIADSSLSFDLGRKQELYLESGIPEYWVVNLREEVVELFRDPHDGEWRERTSLRPGQSLQATIGAGVAINMDELLAHPS